jgi:hypothetical protein
MSEVKRGESPGTGNYGAIATAGSFAIPRAFHKPSNFRRENLGKKVRRFASKIPWNDEFFPCFARLAMSLSSLPPILPSVPDSYPDNTPLDLTGILELRVNSPSVRLYPVAQPMISDDILAARAMTPGANSPSTSEQSHLPQAHGGSCWANRLP